MCQEMSFPESVERVAGALGSSPRVECTIKFLYLLIISFLLILIFKILKIVKVNKTNFNINSKYFLIKYKLNRSYQPINCDDKCKISNERMNKITVIKYQLWSTRKILLNLNRRIRIINIQFWFTQKYFKFPNRTIAI